MSIAKKMSFMKNIRIILHFLKLSNTIKKGYILLLIFSSLFKSFVPIVNVIMPKYIIDELMNMQRINMLVMYVALTVTVNFMLSLVNKFITKKINIYNIEVRNGFDLLIGKKVMDLDYEMLEDPEIINMKELAIFPVRDQGTIQFMIKDLMTLFTQMITMIIFGVIVISISWILIVFIILMVLLNTFVLSKIQQSQYRMNENFIKLNREYVYLYNLGDDFSYGKDVRLYDMSPMIVNKLEKYNDKVVNIFKEENTKIGKYEGMNSANSKFQLLGTYAYLVYRLLNGLSIGDFTMLSGATLNFSSAIGECFSSFVSITQKCRYLELYLQFEGLQTVSEMKNKHNVTSVSNIDSSSSYKIEFINVSFKYPKSKAYTLKNINITISDGEKLSVVGLNGAGKTTFIKLLCRLYRVTDGEILLNGVNINDYDYEEYMKLLSVVFQDFKLFAFTVKENISLFSSENEADEEIVKIVGKAGFGNDLTKLKNGIHTNIYKIFDKEGIEFSGGQSQKLAISRAIYKNAPIVILDEPTAALDPFAEYEIYTKFNELVGNKTSIYISHRLSSCRFCDNIAVFRDGEIVEYGTHEQLLESHGLYEEMYMAQAQYYI